MDERSPARCLRTVTGALPPARVRGPVLAHEHLALDLSRGGDTAAVLDGRHRAAVTGELAALREEFGLALVVELTCRGMGRDVRALARIARESGVAVVAGTGWYYERFHPAEAAAASAEELAGELVREIGADGNGSGAETSGTGGGIDGTGVRPGVIGEAGSGGDAPSAAEVRTLTAAALAARATGLSVATHAQLGRGGPAQLELLTAAGLPPYRVSIGHQDLLDDPGVHRELASAGAYVAFDTVGKENYRSDEARLRALLALLEAGHAERALLSCDISRYGYLTAEGGTGYGHLFRSFLPRLRAAGADEDTIDLLTRRNPLRFLTGGAGDATAESAAGSPADPEEP
ncbi:phosphotriesterase-related protein [Streptomyces sp. Amel2xB2]|uniref:phosphotriesterase family protein n=1 Tax=Streptomyces sp. Amel2xB2 TaxID=1305829 RepID=UPI000DB90CD3|nr:phosphotriesterase [Streptomyces sp. Amel2xB2]RAJ63473.1 phosphotriesterase-related protein [Streptomyces sp. Amel2xB2]